MEYKQTRGYERREYVHTAKRSMWRKNALQIGERLYQQLQQGEGSAAAHARDAQPNMGGTDGG